MSLNKMGLLNEKEMSEWINETIPLAQQLIGKQSPFYLKKLEIKTQFVEPDTLPLGRWMGCYPLLVGETGQLTVISDWSFYLEALGLALRECVSEAGVLETALLDKSRIKLGIVNDVYQPFAPLPEEYSMVRHHSLILYLALEWLGKDSQNQWLALCEGAGKYIAERLSQEDNPILALQDWEHLGRQKMQNTAVESCEQGSAVLLLSNEAIMADVKRYLQLTCFGIDVLAWSHSRAVDKQEWVKTEISKLNRSQYLEKDIIEYLALR